MRCSDTCTRAPALDPGFVSQPSLHTSRSARAIGATGDAWVGLIPEKHTAEGTLASSRRRLAHLRVGRSKRRVRYICLLQLCQQLKTEDMANPGSFVGQLSQHHSQPLLAFRLSVRSFCLQLNDPLKPDLANRNSQMTPLERVLASKTDEKISTHLEWRGKGYWRRPCLV